MIVLYASTKSHFSFVCRLAEDAFSFDPAVDSLAEQMSAVLVNLSIKHKAIDDF